MTIQDRLSELRQRFATCEIAAFADLSTKMVLASSAGNGVTQEQLEGLCARACNALISETSETVNKTLGIPDSDGTWYTIAPGLTMTECFIRSPASPEEALCLRLISCISLDELVAAARSLLQDIGVDACH